jgi:hypothetical protein
MLAWELARQTGARLTEVEVLWELGRQSRRSGGWRRAWLGYVKQHIRLRAWGREGRAEATERKARRMGRMALTKS